MTAIVTLIMILAAVSGEARGREAAPVAAALPRALVRVLSVSDEKPAVGRPPIEPWIVEAITAAGYDNPDPSADWVELNETASWFYQTMMVGRVILGRSHVVDGGVSVTITGRAISPPVEPIHLTPGQTLALRITSDPGKRNVFLAMRATAPGGSPVTPPSGFAIDAVIDAVDEKEQTIAATWDGQKHVEKIRNSTRISLDGKEAGLSDVKAGMKAWLHIISKGDRYVLEIRAVSKK